MFEDYQCTDRVVGSCGKVGVLSVLYFPSAYVNQAVSIPTRVFFLDLCCLCAPPLVGLAPLLSLLSFSCSLPSCGAVEEKGRSKLE